MLPVPGFAIATGVIAIAVVALAHASQRNLTPDPDGGAWLGEDYFVGPRELYLNVIGTQLLVVGALLLVVWLSELPWTALGTAGGTGTVIIGVGLGVILYLANEASITLFDRFGIGYSEALRGALAPSSIAGWAVLLLIVLPVIATAEELLFRAALIGGLEASLGVSPWLLVLVSSVLFAVGHGIQGMGGILVTGTLGIVLGVAYVLSGSLLLVVVAHYVINALEFIVNEGIGRGREAPP